MAAKMANETICMPMNNSLLKEEIQRVINCIIK